MKKIPMIIAFAIVTIAISCTEQRHVQSCPTLNFNGITYSLEPCLIKETITEGDMDREFIVTIKQNHCVGYEFSVWGGYQVGLPTYGMLSDIGSSGGGECNQILHMHLNNRFFSADGKNPKVYKGYIPIHIYNGTEPGLDSNFLRLSVVLLVNPRK